MTGMDARGRAIRSALKAMNERAPAGTACGVCEWDRPCHVMRIDGLCIAVCGPCKWELGHARLVVAAALFQYAVTMDDPADGDPLGGAGM